GFRTSLRRHPTQDGVPVFGSYVIQILAVGRLRDSKSTIPGHLRCRATTRGHLPDLVLAAAVRTEIDPAPVSRAVGEHVVVIIGQALGYSTFRIDDVNPSFVFHARVKCDALAVR